MSERPIVAVVPFGARGKSPRAGAIARQLARRIVDRFARETALELRPVFLVAMPEASADAGYLVFGSSPDAALAAQYASSSGATHALTATFREEGAARVLDASLVDAKTAVAETRHVAIAEGDLQRVETEVAAWVARSLGVTPTVDLASPPTENEAAYVALLEGMDDEVNATLLRPSDPARAREALQVALARYVDAARADPASDLPEERVLVVAAESLERGDVTHEVHALEELVTVRPRSWRTHYILGQLRAEAGDLNGAIVATEHAHAIKPLPDADLVRL